MEIPAYIIFIDQKAYIHIITPVYHLNTCIVDNNMTTD